MNSEFRIHHWGEIKTSPLTLSYVPCTTYWADIARRPSREMAQTTAQTLESGFQVVHAIPGRVRLRTTDSSLSSTLNKVAQQLRQQDGVCEVQTHPTTHSLVITFDESTQSLPETLERLHTVGITERSGTTQSLPKIKSEPSFTVVHEIPGRIRLRVPRLATDPDYAHRLTVLTQTDANVINMRVNTAAASIAIRYDTGAIADKTIRSHLIQLIQTASKPNILLDLKAASPQQEPEAESNLWSGLALPTLSATLALLGGPMGLPIPPLIIGGTIALAALPVARRAFESILNEQRLNIDFLDLTAITITTLQGQFISPSLMILLVEIGEAIREQTAKSSKLQTLDLLDSLEQFVWVERNGQKQRISIHDVQKGDTVIVYPGSQIPVDGRIIRGKALIDEQKLTGEAMPVMRRKGQSVYTSTLVREGQLYIQAESVGAAFRVFITSPVG